MIEAHLYRDGVASDVPTMLEEIPQLIERDDVFLWLDVVAPSPQEIELLGREFMLHPLVLEDLEHRHQRPKVELYAAQAFLVLRPVVPADGDGMQELEMHALVGRRYLVTIRYEATYELASTVRRWERQPELLAVGGGFAAYVLLDEVVDDYLTLVERFEDAADELEDLIFADDGPEDVSEIQERLFKLKRDCVRLRRRVMPLRQGIDLLQEEPELATAPLAPYYRDVVDHVIRTVELVDNIRDLLTAMLEVRVAQVANHLNEVMKKLTAWAAIILVPTLIAGIYGMNFEHMPELRWQTGYPLALGTMAVSAVVLYAIFKRRDWL
jgi:magnesium transporter